MDKNKEEIIRNWFIQMYQNEIKSVAIDIENEIIWGNIENARIKCIYRNRLIEIIKTLEEI